MRMSGNTILVTGALVEHLSGPTDGTIVNVSSGLAFVPLVTAPTYAATKAGLHAYTVALREALRGRVEVIELVPSAVQTGLTPGPGRATGLPALGGVHGGGHGAVRAATDPARDPGAARGLPAQPRGQHRFDAAVTTLNEFARAARDGQ